MTHHASFLFSSVLLLSVYHSSWGFSNAPSDPLWENEFNAMLDICEEESTIDTVFPSAASPDLLVEESPKKADMAGVSENCKPDIQPYQVNIRHSEWEGIGYKEGYSTLEGFFAPSMGAYIPFLDLRAHVFNDGRFASNVGIGTRYVIQPDKWMVGANFYYDYRKTKHSHFNQIAAGLESFMGRWEFRANGYLPVGSKTHLYDKKLEGISFEGFQGHYLLIFENYSQKRECAMKGFNAEVGVHPLKIMRNYDLFVGAGPYYFHGKGNSTAWGGKVRAKAEIAKHFFLEISDSYDRVFHNRFQAQITVSIPFGGRKLRPSKNRAGNTPASCFADNVMYWRGSQPVERQEIIVVHKDTQHITVDPVAINAATGQPFYFVFVNNTANLATADGTFENPFPNLSTGDGAKNAQDASVPGNIIYVFSGDGTSANMQNGILLKDAQRFLGSGVTHQFVTTKGSVVVPAFTSDAPLVDNTVSMSAVVALPAAPSSSNNEVSGFNLMSIPGETGIGVDGSGNVIGTVSLNRNSLNGNASINIGIGDAANVSIDNNQMSIGGIIVFINSNVASSLSITNNRTSTTSPGIDLQAAGGSTVTALISGNDVTSFSRGITISPTSAVNCFLNLKIFNNNVHDGQTAGIFVSTGALNVGTINLDVENNVLTNNAFDPGFVFNVDGAGSSGCLRLVNNTASFNNAGVDYQIITSAGIPFSLEPPSGNIGAISFTGTGTVTFVPPCSCQGCP